MALLATAAGGVCLFGINYPQTEFLNLLYAYTMDTAIRKEFEKIDQRARPVYRHEFEDLVARVRYIEGKLKIKSGK